MAGRPDFLTFRRKKSPSFASSLDTNSSLPTRDDDTVGPLGLSLLHSPSEPAVDVIFVHGLGGGSRKTWSKTNSLAHFWPREWLPKEIAFKQTRIHSFGYDSDWIRGRDNCLNIHHMGKLLLGELSVAPGLNETKTPILFVGHSMGGLVIKKAVILSRQNSAFKTLADRIRAIYFLATPHRGAESAKLLNNILQIAFASREYIADLERNSGALQSINDDFRNYSSEIDLWSFYETQKLKFGGLMGTLIVDPESATLGYREERQMPVNADHRSICKFEAPTDPNYVCLRNSLISTIQNLENLSSTPDKRSTKKQMRDLEKYLDVPAGVEEDLNTINDARTPGTCSWLFSQDSYRRWRSFSKETPRILYLTGPPAAGKSVLAAHVVDQLRTDGMDCSFFFFKHGDRSKSRLSGCLRSLALQMAAGNGKFHQYIEEMREDSVDLCNHSERTLWGTLFARGVFETQPAEHLWVIDALDECKDVLSPFLSMLCQIKESVPLRILITSRDTLDLESKVAVLGPSRIMRENILKTSTLCDMRLLIENKVHSFRLKDVGNQNRLIEKILAMSEGSFLWTTLVLEELSNSFEDEDIHKMLDTIPRDMIPLYQRALQTMAQGAGSKRLAQAILVWTTCATRPLSLKELEEALFMDLDSHIIRLEESVLALCGCFVSIDKLGKVVLVHQTAKEFLLTPGLNSEYAINIMESHTRIARVCLKFLSGDGMRPPRTQGGISSRKLTINKTEFSAYACLNYSHHLSRADPQSNENLNLVELFLRSNVLSWIEAIARTGNLSSLIRAARDLRKYYDRCTVARSPLGRSMHVIRGWNTDLIRIVAKFANALTIMPTAIYSLIPPFCPTGSIIHKTIPSAKRLTVTGLPNSGWDDRLCCLDFRDLQPSTLCFGEEHFAVGFCTGRITFYHAISCHETYTVTHPESVKIMQFRDKSAILASCGSKFIYVWNAACGETIYRFQCQEHVVALAFDGSLLLAASSQSRLKSWNLDHGGAQMADRPWNASSVSAGFKIRSMPMAVSISTSHKMLAVAYSQLPIILWDLEEDAFHSYTGKQQADGEPNRRMMVTSLLFNPNSKLELLAASYLDGRLVILDVFSNEELACTRAQCTTLAASPNGRFLAGGAAAGIIQIYEFDTLKLLYRVKSSDFFIQGLAFSRDGLRVADVRGSQCNIWEPTVLIRDYAGDGSSEATLTSIVEEAEVGAHLRITQLVIGPDKKFVLCSKDDGSISSYDFNTGLEARVLYRHKCSVNILTCWARGTILTSVDISNKVLTWKLAYHPKEGWTADELQFSSRVRGAGVITQITAGETVKKLILSRQDSDHLFNFDGMEEAVKTHLGRSGRQRWIQHPQSQDHVICVTGTSAEIYAWNDWSEMLSVELTAAHGTRGNIFAGFCQNESRRHILLGISELDGSPGISAFYLADAGIFDVARANLDNVETEAPNTARGERPRNNGNPRPSLASPAGLQLSALAAHIRQVMALTEANRLVFLDKKSWVCSVDLQNLDESITIIQRHFFVPHDWFAGGEDLRCAITSREIFFGVNSRVVVVKGWLDFVEKVEVDKVLLSPTLSS